MDIAAVQKQDPEYHEKQNSRRYDRMIYFPSLIRIRYSSHSAGRRYLFLLLQSLQAGTRLLLILFPPLLRGMTWSMVNCEGPTLRLQ